MAVDNGVSRVRAVLVMFAAAVVIAALTLVLQAPGLAIRHVLIGDRVLPSGQFWFLEMLAGLLTSAVITSLAILVDRRFMIWIAAASVAIQLCWVYITHTSLVPIDSLGEILLRSSDALGILLGALVAVLLVRGIFSTRHGKEGSGRTSEHI